MNALSGNLLWLISAREIEGVVLKRCDIDEDVVLLFPVEEVGSGNNVLVPTTMRILFPYSYQAIRVFIRQRPQQDRIDHAENGRIRSDPERQSDDGDRGEPRALAQLPQRIANVLDESSHFISSLEAQCHNRVNLRRAARGNIARKHAHHKHQYCGERERRRISRFYAVKQT